jgi:hypothetical protein
MATLTYYGDEPSKGTTYLYNFAFSLVVACGVHADRRGRAVGTSYEYDAFVFFLWPYLLPVYLFQIRRWFGLLLAFTVFALYLVPWLAASIVYWWVTASGT